VHEESEIESEFVARSSPESPLFRQFLTHAQLRELVQGRDESARAVMAYLREVGATKVRMLRSGDAIVGEVAASIAAGLGYRGRGRAGVALPDALAAHVRSAIVVGPRAAGGKAAAGSSSSSASSASASSGSGSSGQPGMTQTPATIRQRYAVPEPSALPTLPANYTQGVAEYEGEYFADSDISAFTTRYGMPNLSIPVMGPNTPSSGADATEGTLDLEYMSAIAGATIPTWWLAQNTDNNDPANIDFSLWCDSVASQSPMPYVVSISWGMGYERYVNDTSVMVADNDAFRKLGLLGVSVFAASGDSGPGVRSEEFNCNTFTPSWPASSPYLTSVGATYANASTEREVSVNWSGGGFSTVFTRPSWQAAAVKKYFEVAAASLPARTFYAANGRGYPDVSALGTNFDVIVAGQWGLVSGTSAASPTFAGVVSLIVGERLAKGQSALGFLNPKLYQLGRVGYDVVEGASQDTNCLFETLPGFPAAAGWDAVSGLGTPSYTYLRENL
jgi:tripeptidyl-peptidase-1